MSGILYAREDDLPVDDYIDVVGHSELGKGRPIADRERVAAMLAGADLVVTARLDGRCIGIARCLTDFAWVGYLADLAVHDNFQGRGIGKGLLEEVRQELGDNIGMALLSMPGAKLFYDHVGPSMGLKRNDDAYWMARKRGV